MNCLLRRQEGVAAVEMALVLPLLLLLALGLFDIAQAIYANLVISNISREGANLYSRTGSPPPDIMNSLAETTDQLDMVDNGIIYLTKIQETDGSPRVVEQYRWADSDLTAPPGSRVWLCDGSSHWSNGTCIMGGSINDTERTATPGMIINTGEQVVIAEVYYVYRPTFNFFPKESLTLYSKTLL